MLKLPPRYVNVPTMVLSGELPDSVKITLAYFHGLAWDNKGDSTPPATVKDLADLRGLSERQMYEHLASLKGKWIRMEKLDHYRCVIYPLRWEPAAALATDNESEITEAEFDALFESQTCAENRTGLPESPQTSAEDRTMFLKHVVVDSESDSSESKHQHGHGKNMGQNSAENCIGLEQELAAAFVAEGVEPEPARQAAIRYVRKFGPDRCRTHLANLHGHCEAARDSPRGLSSPVGVFVASVKGHWAPAPPIQKSEPKTRPWYAGHEELINS